MILEIVALGSYTPSGEADFSLLEGCPVQAVSWLVVSQPSAFDLTSKLYVNTTDDLWTECDDNICLAASIPHSALFPAVFEPPEQLNSSVSGPESPLETTEKSHRMCSYTHIHVLSQ